MTQQIVTVRNEHGHALHCIWEEPPGARRDLACVLLSPGVKMRVAPHRLYRKVAAEFLQRGIGVLRVDFHGLGDSEGDLPEVQLDQLYRKVQQGRHVADARAALDWLAAQLGIRRVVIGGLCGGALTGLLAAETDERVVGLYAIGIPVTLDGPAEQASSHMTRGELANMRKEYLKKIFDFGAWRRLLLLQSDYKLIFHSTTAALRSRLRRRKKVQSRDETPAPASAPAPNFNGLFARALFRMLRRGAPVLMLFSGSDRLYFEFQEKFVEPWSQSLQPFGEQMSVNLVPKANHVLGDPAWVAAAREVTAAWLDRRFA